MLDNGNNGLRDDMLTIFEAYLRVWYDDWDKRRLIYDKTKES